MKKIILVLTFFTLTTMANIPHEGSFVHCYDKEGVSEEAFFNLVNFSDNEVGIQFYRDGFPISMIINLDGNIHQTTERISGYSFSYQAGYSNNKIKLAFSNQRDAQILNLNQKTIFNFIGTTVEFIFNQKKLICRMNLR